jgi:putative transposase
LREGFGSKLHRAVDAQGQPVELCLGPGEEHDVARAEELLAGHEAKAVIADKGYDADELVETIRERGAQAVIPTRTNRTKPRKLSKRLYKDRNLVERFVNRIKHYWRISTPYGKTARNYLAFVHLAASLVMLGVPVNMT